MVVTGMVATTTMITAARGAAKIPMIFKRYRWWNRRKTPATAQAAKDSVSRSVLTGMCPVINVW